MFDRELAQIRGLLLRGETYPARRPARQPNTTLALAGYSAPADALGITRPPGLSAPAVHCSRSCSRDAAAASRGSAGNCLAAVSSRVRVALRVVSSLSSPVTVLAAHLHTCQVPQA